jgi:hypothetical protein
MISSIGWSTPVSLFECITETSAVSASTAPATSPAINRPEPSTRARVTRQPRRSSHAQGSAVAGCSIVDVITCRRSGRASTTPRIARLFASVPPEVNKISSASAPIAAATLARASSTAARARRPHACALDGLPNPSRNQGSIASSTSGSTGVVAL